MKSLVPPKDGISIHTLYTEGDDVLSVAEGYIDISIHTLYTEGDSKFTQKF